MPGAWDDIDDMPLSSGVERRSRIAELLRTLAEMRPGRRWGDPARLTRLEAELMLLLNAELIRHDQQKARGS
jgi:hypothetical protein